MAFRYAVISGILKNLENSADKVKIKKPASECTKEVHDRAGYLHILAFRCAVIRVFKNSENSADKVISRRVKNFSVDRPT